ncbi:hypothetical protein O3P69_006982 [Scylla paramamosain]|uniref:Uncharacterized protein n=1 Tax=Scylla paramamosain TaxID=85552 RepID=A0AAW0V1Y4_SCYPA
MSRNDAINKGERWYYIFGIPARGSLSQPHHGLCGGNTLRPHLHFCVLTTQLLTVKPADSRAAAAAAGSPEQQQQQQRVAILPCRAADAGAPLPLAASPALDGTFMILFSWHKGHISPGNCILSTLPLILEIGSFPATGIVNCSHSGPRDFSKPPTQTDIIPLRIGTSCCPLLSPLVSIRSFMGVRKPHDQLSK